MSNTDDQEYDVQFDFSGLAAEMKRRQNRYFSLQNYIFQRQQYSAIIANFMFTISIEDQIALLENLAENARMCKALCKKYGWDPSRGSEEVQ